MKWPCWIVGHQYEEVARRGLKLFDDHSSQMPVEHLTQFLFKCKVCGKLKVKRLKGTWTQS